MRRVLGRLIWSQSRDIRILNYPRHFVYEIWTNQGYMKICHDKDTNHIQRIDELLHDGSSMEAAVFSKEQSETVFVPTLK